MNDNLHDFFKENNFDIHEPHKGHEARFLKKLQQPKKKTIPLKWMSLVASVLLLIGFFLGSQHQKKQYDLKDVSPKMAEVQNFFTTTISQELRDIEKYRTLDTETIIEKALDEIEELEDQYNKITVELKISGNKRFKIQRMIENYQQRVAILQRLLTQLDELENATKTNKQNDEII